MKGFLGALGVIFLVLIVKAGIAGPVLPDKSIPKWVTLITEQNGSIHDLDANSISNIEDGAIFTYVHRTTWKTPVGLRHDGRVFQIKSAIVKSMANCKTRLVVLVDDVLIGPDGNSTLIGVLTLNDIPEEPPEDSLQDMIFKKLCKKPIKYI
jgi:hypothetical protein